jgi:glycosyltransferase involved in cell wall biosynthesis
MKVEVIIPTLNAERTIFGCLESIFCQTVLPLVTIVDCGSSDDTRKIAESFPIKIITSEKGIGLQRNAGADASNAEIFGFIDADMYLQPDVIEKAISCINSGALGVVIPEVSIGSSYWAHVRRFERSFYVGDFSPEAARFFPRTVFYDVGGYDERLSAMEDYAFDRSVRSEGKMQTVETYLFHDEGSPSLISLCKKKSSYAQGMKSYMKIYGKNNLTSFITGRPYLRSPQKLLKDPKLGVGVVLLKLGEAVTVAWSLLSDYFNKRRG